MRGQAAVMIMCAGLGAGACTGQTDTVPASASALGSTAADLDRDVFLPGCAFGACHGATRPAARLNLGAGICGVQLDGPSCLFPSKRLIVPGHPEQSFLIDKLSGENLTATPETDCSTTGNARMPYGGAPLSAETIERVRTWISGGSPFPVSPSTGAAGSAGSGLATGDRGGSGPGGSGSNGAGGGAGGSSAWRLGFEETTTHVRSGARTTMTLTVAPAAGAAGLSVALSPDDASALGVPGAVFVPAATTQVSFDVQGKRPSSAVHLTATVGDARAEATVAIDGLFISEVFYGGTPVASPGDHSQWVKIVNVTDAPIDLGGYQIAALRAGTTETALPLTGVLEPATCLVVGGSPGSDFVPDIPRLEPNKPGVAVVLGPVAPSAAPSASLPLDAVMVGAPEVVVVPDGPPVSTAAASLAPGHSLSRTGHSTWLDLARPTQDACPRWW